eukprot:3405853-Amphidinium_carterae.1
MAFLLVRADAWPKTRLSKDWSRVRGRSDNWSGGVFTSPKSSIWAAGEKKGAAESFMGDGFDND